MIVQIRVQLDVQVSQDYLAEWSEDTVEERLVNAAQFIGLQAVMSLVGRGDTDGYKHASGSKARVYKIVAPDSPEPEASGTILFGEQPEEAEEHLGEAGDKAMKMVRIEDFLTKEQVDLAISIGPDHARLKAEVIEPNMEEINRKLSQENDASYLAYALIHAIQQVGGWRS